jgi:energy-coupling factor transport system ATP-binding protein
MPTNTATAAVSLIDLFYAYPVNNGFTLDVPELKLASGVCAALIGDNGSGKTTLGKLIAGILRPVRGRVMLGEDDIAGWPLGKIGCRVGYLFQEPSRQIFAPSVLEELTFPMELKGMPSSSAREAAKSMLSRFELGYLENAVTYTLSRGEKQRLAIIAMLASEPGFIVMDEPTTGLDSRHKSILGGMIRQLTPRGAGILLISHDAEFVAEYATITYWMEKGQVVSDEG